MLFINHFALINEQHQEQKFPRNFHTIADMWWDPVAQILISCYINYN